MKIAIYRRYSTKNQNLETQRKEVMDYLDYKKIDSNEIKYFTDEALSGSKSDRPNYLKLIEEIKGGLIKKVICTKMDRLSRNLIDLQTFLVLCKDNKVELIFIKDNIETDTPHGKLFFDMMGSFIEFERNNIIDRMKSGLERAKREGKICNRPKKVLNMRRIIKLHDENKISFSSIKKILESEGTIVSIPTIIKRYNDEKMVNK